MCTATLFTNKDRKLNTFCLNSELLLVIKSISGVYSCLKQSFQHNFLFTAHTHCGIVIEILIRVKRFLSCGDVMQHVKLSTNCLK